MVEYFSAVALEDLKNGTLAIKVGDGVRNIRGLQDIQENLVVYISNARTVTVDGFDVSLNEVKRFVIPKGKMVRFVRLRVG